MSGFNFSTAKELVSIVLSFNNLTSLVEVIFSSTCLNLFPIPCHLFALTCVRTPNFRNLATFKMDNLVQSKGPTSTATIETISYVQLWLVSDRRPCVRLVPLAEKACGWWMEFFVVHQRTRERLNKRTNSSVTRSTLTASRHGSFKEERTTQRRTLRRKGSLCSGIFCDAIGSTSLVYKQAVMKMATDHSQNQDRDIKIAFMNMIWCMRKVGSPDGVGFLGIMSPSLSNFASIVEYGPRGGLAVYLNEKKSSQKNSQSTFTWNEFVNESFTKLSLSLQMFEALVSLQSFAPPVIYGHLKTDCILLGSL
ncbi:unnamed protein product [Peronospora farinosa]|uniref:Protein kinase domain-containing protein n=1 Tax=Peronospora farinosa TaxID=134698 RepID=A0ABN8C7J6_9STRA|nr:unnamed protein product [Peronospora farinosa]